MTFRQPHWLLLVTVPCFGSANANEQLRNNALEFLGQPPAKSQSPNHNLVPLDRIALGQHLFADPQLLETDTQSCA